MYSNRTSAQQTPIGVNAVNQATINQSAVGGVPTNGGGVGVGGQPQELFRRLIREYTCSLCHVKFQDKAGLEIHHPCYFKRPGLDPRQSVGGPYTCHFAGCGKMFDLMYALRYLLNIFYCVDNNSYVTIPGDTWSSTLTNSTSNVMSVLNRLSHDLIS